MISKHKTRHFINGKDFGEPRNWEELTITKNFTDDKENISINITDIEFVSKANKYLQERVLNGLVGGVGVFEGEPYKIVLGDVNNPVYEFNGYLDFTDNTTFIGGESFVCSLKKTNGSDWLNDVADSFSFEYLAKEKVIKSSDYVKVPYVINYIPDGLELITLSISLFMMTKELIENVQSLAEAIGDVTDSSTPVIGVGSGLGVVAVIAWDIGNFILVTLKLIARIAYLIAITIAIKELVNQIFNQLLPDKRYHLGMTPRKMLEKGCQFLGLNFQSDIEDLNLVLIPKKDKKGGAKGEKGVPTSDGNIYTFGEAIRVFKDLFNADFAIIDGTFYFQRKDKFISTSNYKLPMFFGDQKKMLNPYGLNTDEMICNYNISFAADFQDQNTMDDQTGRTFQAITRPVSIVNKKLVNLKGLAEVKIPFSLGKTKTNFTAVEELGKDLGKFVDNLTGIFGRGTNFSSKIKSRVGSLLLSSDFLTVGKLVKMNGNKLAREQRKHINANLLWEKYHFINSFAEVKGVHNQYYIHKDYTVPMSLEDFSKLLENNVTNDENGNVLIIDKIEFQPHKGKAIIDFRVNKKYTNNLKVEYV